MLARWIFDLSLFLGLSRARLRRYLLSLFNPCKPNSQSSNSKGRIFFRETVFESWSSPSIAGRWPRGSSGTSRSPVSRSGQPLRRSSGPGPWRKPSTPSSTNLSPEKFTNTIRFGASVASQRFSGVGIDSIKKMEACKNAAASLFYKGGQPYKRSPQLLTRTVLLQNLQENSNLCESTSSSHCNSSGRTSPIPAGNFTIILKGRVSTNRFGILTLQD